MRTRFFYNSLLALTAGFLVVATQAFAPVTVAWITFGIGVGITAVALAMIPLRAGLLQRGLAGLTVGLGAWTIVLSLVFAPTTVVWLGFASAIAFVALAFAGLTVHELTTERIVHSLDIPVREREREPLAA
jgi:thiamine transporter ThiT